MSVVVPDSGVLIEMFRHADMLVEKDRHRWRFYISAVVHSELARGATTPTEKRFIANLVRAFPPVAPTAAEWAEGGEVLSRLRRERNFDGRGMQFLQNDVLIALTAHGIGVPLVTTNLSDFGLIAKYVRGLKVIGFGANA